MKNRNSKKTLLLALKIAIGSSLAIYIAYILELQNVTSAGTIALLTILTTKWETVRLSVARVITFIISTCFAFIFFSNTANNWEIYGLYMFFVVLISESMGWRGTISVNGVIGTHFLLTGDFSPKFIFNEFLLVLIGISVAFLLNLFNNNTAHKKKMVLDMRHTEEQLQQILKELGAYLLHQEMNQGVWEDIQKLDHSLKGYIQDACEYQENTFRSHPGYYIDYFEMRLQQCGVLQELNYEMKRIRNMPLQADIIAKYMLYLVEYVVETNVPTEQIKRLEGIFEQMKEQPLPVSREEFENRAVLYHVLVQLEAFLDHKKRFVENLDERQLRLYWKEKVEQELPD